MNKKYLIKLTKDVGFVEARMIEVGEALEEGDLYMSSSGHYDHCPCPGVIWSGSGVTFYRPIK